MLKNRNHRGNRIRSSILVEGISIFGLSVLFTAFFILLNDYNPMQPQGHLRVTSFFVISHLIFTLLVLVLFHVGKLSQDLYWGLLISVVISLTISKRITLMQGLPGAIGWNSNGTGDYFEIIKMSKLDIVEIVDIDYPPLYPLIIKFAASIFNQSEELATKRILILFAYLSYFVLYFFLKSQFSSFVSFTLTGAYISLSDDIDATYKSLSFVLFFAFFILFYQNLIHGYRNNYVLIVCLFSLSLTSYFGAIYFYFHATLILIIVWLWKYAKLLGAFFVFFILINPSLREIFTFLFFHQTVFLGDNYQQTLSPVNYPFSIYLTLLLLSTLLGIILFQNIFEANHVVFYPLLILASNSFLVQLLIIYGISNKGFVELWPRGGGLTLTILFSVPILLISLFVSNQINNSRSAQILIYSILIILIFITLETQELFNRLPLNDINLTQIYQEFLLN
jgi:hypothetical protein